MNNQSKQVDVSIPAEKPSKFKHKSQLPVQSNEEIERAREAFISGAKDEQTTGTVSQASTDMSVHEEGAEVAPLADPYQLIRRTEWPITFLPIEPIYAEGRKDIDRQFIMRMKENLMNSLDQHCAALGVPKAKWVREAIKRQLYEEQQHFLEK